MESIEIGGKELPFLKSIGAHKKFDNKFKAEGISTLRMDPSKLELEHIVYLLFCYIEAGFKAQGEKCDITLNWFDDLSVDDMTVISEAISGGATGNAQKKT